MWDIITIRSNKLDGNGTKEIPLGDNIPKSKIIKIPNNKEI